LQLNHSNYTCTEQGWNFLNNTLEYFLPSQWGLCTENHFASKHQQ
jgi:hypothetical protein